MIQSRKLLFVIDGRDKEMRVFAISLTSPVLFIICSVYLKMSEMQNADDASHVSATGYLIARKGLKETKLTDGDSEILISEVQSRPCLWNDRYNDFKNSTLTRKLWEEVGASVNLSGVETKKKWKNLKDKYRKILQKPSPKSGSGGVTTTNKWRFFEMMAFTRDLLIPAQMIGSLTPSIQITTPETETQILGDDLSETDDFDEDSGILEPEPHESRFTPTTEIPRNRSTQPIIDKRFSRPHRAKSIMMTKHDLEKKMIQLEEKKIEAIITMQKSKEKKAEEGDDYYFLMSLLPFIRHLPPLQKLEVRSRIQSVVMESYKHNEMLNEGAFIGHSHRSDYPWQDEHHHHSHSHTTTSSDNSDIQQDPNYESI